jgi:small subunit ribosomal protein S9
MSEKASADPQTQAAGQPEAAPAGPVKPPPTYVWGTGRRKTAVARVRIRSGSGNVLINKRSVEEYFKAERDRQAVSAPLEATRLTRNYDVWVNVRGGGPTGQADAVKLGLARALVKAVPELGGALRDQGLLTRDARITERKKYGLRGARRSFQFSKR